MKRKKYSEMIAIDLLWLRPGKVGGTEFFIRNLLDGFLKLDDAYNFILILSKDNADTFKKYLNDKRFYCIVAPIKSKNICKRILWQIFFQNLFFKKNGINKCFVPVYCRPFFNNGIQYVNVIHDLQAYHYPQYHPLHEIWYSKLCWIVDKYKSKSVVAISEYVKNDLISTYHIPEKKIKVIFNPVIVGAQESSDFLKLSEKYNVTSQNYYYTIAQFIPHKNLLTLIAIIKKIKDFRINLPTKLLISGISGIATDNIKKKIKEYKLEKNVILTGFIENNEKYELYRNCKAFLFPSIFEGFGMPPVEAMMLGVTVITTKCTSIPEVTEGKANYVDDPMDVNEWIDLMQKVKTNQGEINKELFNPVILARKYLRWLQESMG